MLRGMLWALQVAGEAVKDAPSWAGPDVIIATTMDKLDHIVAAANAQASPPTLCWPNTLGLTGPPARLGGGLCCWPHLMPDLLKFTSAIPQLSHWAMAL